MLLKIPPDMVDLIESLHQLFSGSEFHWVASQQYIGMNGVFVKQDDGETVDAHWWSFVSKALADDDTTFIGVLTEYRGIIDIVIVAAQPEYQSPTNSRVIFDLVKRTIGEGNYQHVQVIA